MKYLILFVFLISTAFAETRPVAAVMQDMQKTYKIFSSAIRKNSAGDDVKASVQKFITLSQEAMAGVPYAMQDLPAEEKAAALLQYHQLIQELTKESIMLLEALNKGDLGSAQVILKSIDTLKEQGHAL